MNFLVTRVLSLLIITLTLLCTQVGAQVIPDIVIARPGQNVTLSCSVSSMSTNDATVGWSINHVGPYGVSALLNGQVSGYSASLDTANLIIENIMTDDHRNDTEYRCTILQNTTIRGDPTFLYVAGVPRMVPNVTITNNTNGSMVTLTLSWREPFNNFDPIMKYRVSCSGDAPCPLSVDTTDNTTRSYTFNDFTTGSDYIFSVVAINSIGSGKAGVVMIGEVITTTIAAPLVSMITTTTSSLSMTIASSNEDMTTTNTTIDDMMATTTTIPSESIMTTMLSTENMITATTTTANTKYTSSSNDGMIVSIIATTTPNTIAPPPSPPPPTTTTSVSTSPSLSITTTTPPAASSTTSHSTPPDDSHSTPPDNGSSDALPIIIIIIVAMILCCCCFMCFLFCCCCERKERYYRNEKLCVDPRSSFVTHVILGVVTFGISILVWYIYLKNHSDGKGQSKYCKITNVSIIVLGIYTCGTSVLFWWLYKQMYGFCNGKEKDSFQDQSVIPLSIPAEVKSPTVNEVPSASNQLAKHDGKIGHSAVPYENATPIRVTSNEEPVRHIQGSVPVPNNEESVTSVINEMYEEHKLPAGYAVVDTQDVIARQFAAAAGVQHPIQQDSIQHKTLASGEKYALPSKTAAKGKVTKYAELQELPCTGRINTSNKDAVTPYAELT